MSSNINQFLKDLEKQKKAILKNIETVMVDITTEIFNALLEDKAAGGTPRLTGWLAASWNISVDSPDKNLVGSKTNVSAARSVQEASYNNFISSDLTTTKMIYINNVVPYGEAVNYGDSSYMGFKFREDSIARGKSRFFAQRKIK